MQEPRSIVFQTYFGRCGIRKGISSVVYCQNTCYSLNSPELPLVPFEPKLCLNISRSVHTTVSNSLYSSWSLSSSVAFFEEPLRNVQLSLGSTMSTSSERGQYPDASAFLEALLQVSSLGNPGTSFGGSVCSASVSVGIGSSWYLWTLRAFLSGFRNRLRQRRMIAMRMSRSTPRRTPMAIWRLEVEAAKDEGTIFLFGKEITARLLLLSRVIATQSYILV